MLEEGDWKDRRKEGKCWKKVLFGDLSEPLFNEDDFVEAFGIKDWKDKWQVQNGRITGGPHDQGLPTLRDSVYVCVCVCVCVCVINVAFYCQLFSFLNKRN